MKPKLVIYGCGSQAKIVADIIRMCGEYKLIGCLDDRNQDQQKGEFSEVPILGGKEQLENIYKKGIRDFIVAIGDSDSRMEIAEMVLAKGFSLAIAIHPHASIADGVPIGPGTAIKSQAVIEPGAIIKKNVIIGAQTYIGHECVIEDGVHISGGSKIGGNTVIGEGSWIGIGGTVINQLQIGKRVHIGAGSVVLEDIPDNKVAFGMPARILWDRDLWDSSKDKQIA